MKIFISMGMKSKSTQQVRVEMQKAFEHIKKQVPEAELIDSVIEDADADIAQNGDSQGIWYLGQSLQYMAKADLVFFVNDWKEFRGCNIERMVAEKYNKLCVEVRL